MTAKTITINLAGLFLCLLAAWVCGYTHMLAYAPSVPDFESYYLAAQAWQEEGNPYVWQNLVELKSDSTTGAPFPYLYTPPTAQGVGALTRLPFADAARTWGTALVLVYGLCMFLTAKLCFRLGRRFEWIPDTLFQQSLWVVLAIAVGLVFPYFVNLACGQVNIFILLLLLAYLLLYAEENVFSSGMALGAASALKIVPVFLLLAHIRVPRFFWMGFITGALGVVLLSVAVFGSLPWLQFWQALPHFSYGTRVEGLWEISVPYNIALSGKWARLFQDQARPIFWAGVSTGLPVLGYYFFSAKKVNGFSPAFFLRIGAATVLMLLFSPIAYVHHLVWLFPPVMVYLVFLLYGPVRRRLLWAAVLAGVLSLCLVDFTVLYYTFPITAKLPFYFSVNTFGLLALAGMLLVSGHRAAKKE